MKNISILLLLITSSVLYSQTFVLEKRETIKERMDKEQLLTVTNDTTRPDMLLIYTNHQNTLFYKYYFDKYKICYKAVYETKDLNIAESLEDKVDNNYIKVSDFTWKGKTPLLKVVKRVEGENISYVYLVDHQ